MARLHLGATEAQKDHSRVIKDADVNELFGASTLRECMDRLDLILTDGGRNSVIRILCKAVWLLWQRK